MTRILWIICMILFLVTAAYASQFGIGINMTLTGESVAQVGSESWSHLDTGGITYLDTGGIVHKDY
jgi:hypothetical protein